MRSDGGLRTLVAHCYYRERGGEDASFEAEMKLLVDRGARVVPYVRRNEEIDRLGLIGRLGLAPRTIWAADSYRSLRRLLKAERPAVAHFQNTFPLVSPSAYDACRAEGVPVVQSLRNYRLICPNALLLRDGRVCEDCVGRRVPWPGVVHACYRNSRLQTGVAAAMLGIHNAGRTWLRKVDVFIALSSFARRMLIEGGLPAQKIVVKPNFAEDLGSATAVPSEGSMLYVGRLSREKGVEDLISAAGRLGVMKKLRIVGDGPERSKLEQLAGDCSIFAGNLERSAVVDEMRRAACLVLPSRCFETFGRVIVEAFACGRPMIVSRGGALEELVDEGRTGYLFKAGDVDGLAAALDRALRDPNGLRRMGVAAREEYEAKYTAEINYRILIEVYRRAIKAAKPGS